MNLHILTTLIIGSIVCLNSASAQPGFFTRGQDYGIIRLHVNGQPVGALVDGYNPRIEPSGPVSFGRVDLKAGVNELVVELIGKDVRSVGYSDGYLVGIDGFWPYP